MVKRTTSMELQAIRNASGDSPPPAPAGTTVREWFAGLALSNQTLMDNVPPGERAVEAVRLADELIAALSAPRVPSQESLAAPSEEELSDWSATIAHEREISELRNRATTPAIPTCRTYTTSMLPPLPTPSPAAAAFTHFKRATAELKRGSSDPGHYSVVTPVK